MRARARVCARVCVCVRVKRETKTEGGGEREGGRESENVAPAGEVGGWGRDPKKCTGRDWGMGSSTI